MQVTQWKKQFRMEDSWLLKSAPILSMGSLERPMGWFSVFLKSIVD